MELVVVEHRRRLAGALEPFQAEGEPEVEVVGRRPSPEELELAEVDREDVVDDVVPEVL